MYTPKWSLASGCILVAGLLILLSIARGCQPEPADRQALKLAGRALELVDDIRQEETRDKAIAQLLTGLGYILAIGIPVIVAAVLVYVQLRTGKEDNAIDAVEASARLLEQAQSLPITDQRDARQRLAQSGDRRKPR